MSDVDVGEGWRRLKPGEVIRQGDQVQSGADWILTSRAGWWTLKEKDRLYRRRVADEARAATLRPRTPGEAAAYAEGMAASVVADLMRERDAAREECKRQSAANHTLNDVATALESRVSELKKELKLAKEANAGGFSNQPAASGAGKSAEGGNQEPVKYAVVVGGEMKNTVYDNFGEARDKASEIACRGVPHFVGVVALYREPPRPADWLTDEDRRAVAFAAKVFRGHTIVGPLKQNADQLDALLARETPPRVVLKDFDSSAIPNVDPRYLSGWNQCMNLAKKAIQAAGVEVAEE